tara:strand:+ start:8594 stop:8794 length:201 start_codon:yes stop_codon:yes gene_type:complete
MDIETLVGCWMLVGIEPMLLMRDAEDVPRDEPPEKLDELPVGADVLPELGKLNVDRAFDLVAVVSV